MTRNEIETGNETDLEYASDGDPARSDATSVDPDAVAADILDATSSYIDWDTAPANRNALEADIADDATDRMPYIYGSPSWVDAGR